MVISHQGDTILELADEILVLNNGRLEIYKSANNFFKSADYDKFLSTPELISYQKAILLADLAKATIALYGNEATRLNISEARVGEKVHERLFTEAEKVISSLDSNYSQDSPRLSVEEIKGWLTELGKHS